MDFSSSSSIRTRLGLKKQLDRNNLKSTLELILRVFELVVYDVIHGH